MKKTSQAGLIKLLLLILVAVLILSYFNINIQKVADSPTGQSNFGYLWGLTKQVGNWLHGFYDHNLAPLTNNLWQNASSQFGKPAGH